MQDGHLRHTECSLLGIRNSSRLHGAHIYLLSARIGYQPGTYELLHGSPVMVLQSCMKVRP